MITLDRLGISFLGNIVVLCALSVVPLPVLAQSTKPAYHACLVNYVKPTKSGVAATALQQACRTLFPPESADTMATLKANAEGVYDIHPADDIDDRPFYTCLMNYLPAVHNDQSANVMIQLCREQFFPVSETLPPQKKPNIILQLLGIEKTSTQGDSPSLLIDGDSFKPLAPQHGGQAQ